MKNESGLTNSLSRRALLGTALAATEQANAQTRPASGGRALARRGPAARLQHLQPNSRWYMGSGIYRHTFASAEDYKGNRRKAFNGLCMAIVQSTAKPGQIRVTATSPGLKPGTVTVATKT